nr:hypothetical protein [Desulfobulbaceae bacterium]
MISFTVIISLIISFSVSPAFANIDKNEAADESVVLWSTVNHYTWIYTAGDLPLSEFSFLLNNAQKHDTIHAKKIGSSLHVIFSLKHGENFVEIKHLETMLEKKEIHYFPEFESELVPDEAIQEPFHTSTKESTCSATQCHRLTVDPSDFKPTDIKKQICYQCHAHKFDGFTSLHKPAALEWKCLQCHLEESRESAMFPGEPLRFTIEDPFELATLCYKCHKKLKTFIESQKYLHGPIGMQGCTMCHSPHGSTHEKLLHKESITLCIECHEAKKMINLPVVHKATTQKGCIVCHHQHSSPYRFQLRTDITKLCYTCHPKISKMENNHPVQGHPVFVKETAPSEKFKVSCVSCHSPHSSEYDKLLPLEEMMMLCVNCHKIGSI